MLFFLLVYVFGVGEELYHWLFFQKLIQMDTWKRFSKFSWNRNRFDRNGPIQTCINFCIVYTIWIALNFIIDKTIKSMDFMWISNYHNEKRKAKKNITVKHFFPVHMFAFITTLFWNISKWSNVFLTTYCMHSLLSPYVWS